MVITSTTDTHGNNISQNKHTLVLQYVVITSATNILARTSANNKEINQAITSAQEVLTSATNGLAITSANNKEI